MKRIGIIAVIMTVVLFAGCKGSKKVASYSGIYSEKPTTICVFPVIDKTERKVEKYPQDAEYNNSLNTSAAYLYQTMQSPLLKKGYYVIGPLASEQISSAEPMTTKQLRMNSIEVFSKKYGIDALLIVTIHRWKEENGKWIAFLEYQLRSTKSNSDLMHTWVMATKEVPTNLKSNPVAMKRDRTFAREHKFDNQTAQRCFLVEKVNDYVLRDLPTSSTLRQFEKDQYRNANAEYLKYTWTEEGSADVKTCSLEEYEQECFF